MRGREGVAGRGSADDQRLCAAAAQDVRGWVADQDSPRPAVPARGLRLHLRPRPLAAAVTTKRCHYCGLVLQWPPKHRASCVLQSGEDVGSLMDLMEASDGGVVNDSPGVDFPPRGA